MKLYKRGIILTVLYVWVQNFMGCNFSSERITGNQIREEETLQGVLEEQKAVEKRESVEEQELVEQIQKQLEPSMVRIVTDDLLGSGVIYRQEEDCLWILTAGHVMENWPCETYVTFCDGWTVVCKNVIRAENADIAFLQIPNASLYSDEAIVGTLKRENYAVVTTDKESFDQIEAENRVIAMGSVKAVAENAYEGKMIDPWIYLQDFAQYMMVAQVYTHPGMSGGALLDEQGRFLGILCGVGERDGVDETAVVPLSLILAEEERIFQ